jgi:3-hydroxyisobutyrate dehydrogenase-like beta-hydroxyacid dehydrogenase
LRLGIVLATASAVSSRADIAAISPEQEDALADAARQHGIEIVGAPLAA